ncbi:hypothetical protein AB2T96_20725 [Clostridium butyricum]|uniref:hypothetical protein n=1 Tax=Clostridium butyricum TaxID=1492 RepID=UPI00071B5767|nr:hypothetical protein [Clostridium butyricum]MDU4855030.1 hypothetical protein [Clostridioides difficile]ALP90538.1 hypothetical protein ATN24_10430 [Clostridium butyricum]ALS17041.1 hypothetical protein ATD26_09235 [Clostridium butyricum]ANF14157.1 hypothetical protein AZ909_08875 [Clostridium butyricum]AOR94224.1 hypothetical protein BBB49_09055 [Clostridium butyricum]
MYKEGAESWKLTVSSDMQLNFAFFTGCLYGLIDEFDEISNNRLWPPKCKINKLNQPLSLIKDQWNEWVNHMLNDKGKKILLKESFNFKSNMFNPPNFSDFPFYELKDYCKKSWQYFIEWWQMVGGGKNALSYFEGLDNERIHTYIYEFENLMKRKVKPFNLYIDLVYTGTSNMIEVNNEYIVMIPVKSLYYDKDWWMSKLQQIG